MTTIGSTRAAFHAGQAAARLLKHMVVGAAATDAATGHAPKPTIRPTNVSAPTDTVPPTRQPIAAIMIISRSNSTTTLPCVAPIAIRTPTSNLRRITEWLTIAYTPHIAIIRPNSARAPTTAAPISMGNRLVVTRSVVDVAVINAPGNRGTIAWSTARTTAAEGSRVRNTNVSTRVPIGCGT